MLLIWPITGVVHTCPGAYSADGLLLARTSRGKAQCCDQASQGGNLCEADAKRLLQHADVQKLAAKLHYADQWAASIEVRGTTRPKCVVRAVQPALMDVCRWLQAPGTSALS